MLRISDQRASGRALLRVEGRLVGRWVELLRGSCEEFFVDGMALSLDLGEVLFADREGILLLRELRAQGVTLANCPLFLASQLDGPDDQY